MTKRKLTPGEESAIMARARAYATHQIDTMERYGSAPKLTPEQFEQLVKDCAKPALEIASYTPRPVFESEQRP